mmetsp:Transcript_60087/g.127298  ORF Transcript_60087/g.127298 Transcript_60087/m.127298 type:complete len:491 (-) Transcript_60087:474-1946(-)
MAVVLTSRAVEKDSDVAGVERATASDDCDCDSGVQTPSTESENRPDLGGLTTPLTSSVPSEQEGSAESLPAQDPMPIAAAPPGTTDAVSASTAEAVAAGDEPAAGKSEGDVMATEVPVPQAELDSIPSWQVAQGPRREGFSKVKMLPVAFAKVGANFFGGSIAVAGYAAGTVQTKLLGGKVVDSRVFQTGFKSFLWSNGIMPRMDYRPLSDEDTSKLKAWYPERSSSLTSFDPSNTSLTPVIVSNHISYLDGLMLGSLLKAPKVVAKAGARQVPVLGRLMEEMDTIFVDRNHEDSRRATLNQIQSHCEAWNLNDRPLLIFPEGTTTNGEGLLPFKRGAFVGGVPVRPVLILPTGQWDPATTSYKQTSHGPEATSDMEWVTQFFIHVAHTFAIAVLPPYFPSEAEKNDADLYAKNVHDYMAQELAALKEAQYTASWKAAAGREHGGLGFRLGDVTRVSIRRATRAARSFVGLEGAAEGGDSDSSPRATATR